MRSRHGRWRRAVRDVVSWRPASRVDRWRVALRLEDAARNAVAACEPEDGLRVARRRRRIVAWGAVGALLFAIAFLAVVGPEFEQRRMRRREHCAIEWIKDLYSWRGWS